MAMRPGPNGNDHFNKPLKPNRLGYTTHLANDIQRLHGRGAGGAAGSQAELDAMNRGLPTGPGRKPSGPKASTGERPPNPASKQKASAGSRPPGASKVSKARAASPSAGPKTKDGKPSQMPAKSARTVPSGKAPVPKARPSGKAKAAAAPVPKARPASGPQRKPTTQPAKSANPNVARTAAPAPQKAVDTPWWKKGANTPFRRGPLASQDK